MKKAIFALMALVVMVACAQAAQAKKPQEMADEILASKAAGEKAETSVSAENYLLKHEKLAEQVGLQQRKQVALEKKIKAKASKKYVDDELAKKADKSELAELEGRIQTLEAKQGETEGKVSALESAHNSLEKKHDETREIVNKTVERVGGMEGYLAFIFWAMVAVIGAGVIIAPIFGIMFIKRWRAARTTTP